MIQIFPVRGGQVRTSNGKIYSFKMWWPMRIALGIFSLFGKKFVDTTIAINQTFNGIGNPDQYINITFFNPNTLDQFWGVNLNYSSGPKRCKRHYGFVRTT